MPKLLPLLAASQFLCGPALAAPGDSTKPDPGAASTRGIMRYDANKDGFVDRAEWTAGQEARFKQLDADRDGKLTQDELFARTPSRGDSVVPSDQQVQRQATYFGLLDADKDGSVSLAEFMAQAERNFARCDTDRDGRTNSAECRQALARRSNQPARQDR
jgi:hypothetical protein